MLLFCFPNGEKFSSLGIGRTNPMRLMASVALRQQVTARNANRWSGVDAIAASCATLANTCALYSVEHSTEVNFERSIIYQS